MDVLCYEDLDEFGRDLDDPLAELEQDVVHMLLEAYGSNPDAPERSIGLEDALNGPTDPSLSHRIEAKLTDDPRINAARAVITANGRSGQRIALTIQVNETELGITLVRDALGNIRRTS